MLRIDRFEHFLQPSAREAPPLCYPLAAPLAQMQQCRRENDRNPVMWLAGQDYRAADATTVPVSRPSANGTAPRRGQAEHLADSLSKGDRVMVTGRLRQRSWETPEGDKRSVTEVEADEVGASLKWATAKVERASQRGNGERSSGRERQAERSGDFNDAPPF